MAINVPHVRGAIVNPSTGQPTKLFYDLLGLLADDSAVTTREKYPWDTLGSVSYPVATPSVSQIQQRAIPGTQWAETRVVFGRYQAAIGEWVTVAGPATIVLPPPTQGEYVRVTKQHIGANLDGGNYLVLGQRTLKIPGGVGSVVELTYSAQTNGWVLI
jgi:hypothetical protein